MLIFQKQKSMEDLWGTIKTNWSAVILLGTLMQSRFRHNFEVCMAQVYHGTVADTLLEWIFKCIFMTMVSNIRLWLSYVFMLSPLLYIHLIQCDIKKIYISKHHVDAVSIFVKWFYHFCFCCHSMPRLLFCVTLIRFTWQIWRGLNHARPREAYRKPPRDLGPESHLDEM